MKRRFCLLAAGSAALFFILFSTINSIGAEKITIIELLRDSSKTGEFIVAGYIIEVYECPPCPKGADCAKCLDPNFTLCERKDPQPSDSGEIKNKMVVQGEMYELRKQKKYTFIIRANNRIAGTDLFRWFELVEWVKK